MTFNYYKRLFVIIVLWEGLFLNPSFSSDLSNASDSSNLFDTSRISTEIKSVANSRINHSEIKDWTVLVFMNADSDLRPYAFWDLYEMEAGFQSKTPIAGTTNKTNLIVQLDTHLSAEISRYQIIESHQLYQKPSLSKFQNYTEKDIESLRVEKVIRDENASLGQQLEQFLDWGVKKYPAKNYWVIIWGHGQGWQNKATTDKIEIPYLKNILTHTSLNLHKKVDLLTFDSCLMQTIETISELSTTVRFITGTNQIQNYLGLPYRRIFYELNTGHFNGEKEKLLNKTESRLNGFYFDKSYSKNPHIEEASLDEVYLMAKMLPRLTLQSFNPKNGLQGQLDPDFYKMISASAINTDEEIYQLNPALLNFSVALKDYLSEEPLRGLDLQTTLQREVSLNKTFQNSSIDFGLLLYIVEDFIQKQMLNSKNQVSLAALTSENPTLQNPSPNNPPIDKSLIDNATLEQETIKQELIDKTQLDKETLLLNKIQNLKNAFNRSVTSESLGSNIGVNPQTKRIDFIPVGISVWVPSTAEEYFQKREEFLSSDFYTITHWDEWLKLLF